MYTGTPKEKWSYDEPERWPVLFPTCGGINQSPVDLDTRRMDRFHFENPLDFKYYDHVHGAWSNDGHSLRFDVEAGSHAPEISGGPLEGSYKLLQFHIHWGSQPGQGSEHTINGQA